MLLGSVGHWNSKAFVKMGFMWLFIVLLVHVVFVFDVPVVGAFSMLVACIPFVLMEIVEYFGVKLLMLVNRFFVLYSMNWMFLLLNFLNGFMPDMR